MNYYLCFTIINAKNIVGYHKCSKEEVSRLASLIYRVRFGDNKQELQGIT